MTDKRQQRAKRKTELRVQARIKMKDSRALHKVPAFSALEDAEVDIIIDMMDHIVRFKGTEICHQHDVSDSFYIIVKGSASVTVDDENKETGEIVMDETGLRPKQVEVATLGNLKCFGESALLVEDEEGLRNATVTVTSDKCDLLRLKKSNFIKLMESNEHMFKDMHKDSESVIAYMKQQKLERSQSNRNFLANRFGGGSSVGVKDDDVLDGDEDEADEDEDKKMVPLEGPKGLPVILNIDGLKKRDERSLFS